MMGDFDSKAEALREALDRAVAMAEEIAVEKDRRVMDDIQAVQTASDAEKSAGIAGTVLASFS